jgi:hypothetical protein
VIRSHAPRSAVEIIAAKSLRQSGATARNSREHKRSNDRSTAFNGGDSIQHKVDALLPYAPMAPVQLSKTRS